jgi:Amt family ammonium transporter
MFSSVNTIWVLLGTVLVFFMQAGFALVEAGLTRAKNTGNILMKNLMDFAIGTIVFWVVGFGLMYGTDLGGFMGIPDLFVTGDYTTSSGVPTLAFFMFQLVFCATASTIVSGAMAERTKFLSYCLYSIAISLIIYPIAGHWIWGGGWLAQLGFHDFAGSTAVHMVGGTCALIGAKILGPRIGKYDKKGNPKAILGHNLTFAALGVFILWFAWFGFNAGSSLAIDSDEAMLSVSNIFATTNIAAATGAVGVMIITWIKYKKPDVSMTFNGALGGLVAITAGCDVVSPLGSFFIGIIAAFLVVFGIEFIDKKLKIDDPVGAIGIHFLCGAVGTILVGLFAVDGGLFYGGGFALLGIEALGVFSVMAYVTVVMTLIFLLIKKTVGLRVSREDEIMGLDLSEHNLESAYAGFMRYPVSYSTAEEIKTIPANGEIVDIKKDTVEVNYLPKENESVKDLRNKKLSKIVVIFNQLKYDSLLKAMDDIGITGMTLTYVQGCGVQKGRTEYYRGVKYDTRLLPKVKVEIVVSEVPVDTVVEAIKDALYTGKYGDGKIFVYDVERIVRIRTGEEDYDALQDNE